MVAALGAALLVVAALGCAPEQDQDSQLAVIAGATAEAGTARMVTVLTVAMPAPVGEMVLTMEGVVDERAGALQADLHLEAGSAPTQRGELIIVDGAQYQRGDLARQLVPDLGDGEWVRTSAPEVPSSPLPGATGTSPMDFIAQLGELGELGDAVTSGGRETVRGVGVERLRVSTTVGNMVDAQGDETPEAMAAQLDATPGLREAPVAIDVWADADGLVHRMRMETDLDDVFDGLPGGSGGVSSIIEFELFDHGLDVTIEAPSEDQVRDLDLGGPGSGAADQQVVDLDVEAAPPSSTYAMGPPLPGARDALAQLPYPLGAERVQVASTRVVFEVPGAGPDGLADLEAFFVGQAPQRGWTVLGADAEGAPDDATSRRVVLEGYGAEVTVTMEVDGEALIVLAEVS
jgi:hypothetical protein